MSYVKQFLVILAVAFVGEVMNNLIPLPIPGCIYGMVLLFILLFSGLLKLEKVRDAGRFLVEVQPVMFVAPAASLMTIWSQVQDKIVKYILFGIASTMFVMGVSAIVTQFVIRHWKGGQK